MNTQMRKLAEQAHVYAGGHSLWCHAGDVEKFAQLIVAECAEIALTDGQSTGNFEVFNKITKHFGVKE
jgi:hypothetical protein